MTNFNQFWLLCFAKLNSAKISCAKISFRREINGRKCPAGMGTRTLNVPLFASSSSTAFKMADIHSFFSVSAFVIKSNTRCLLLTRKPFSGIVTTSVSMVMPATSITCRTFSLPVVVCAQHKSTSLNWKKVNSINGLRRQRADEYKLGLSSLRFASERLYFGGQLAHNDTRKSEGQTGQKYLSHYEKKSKKKF